ncbi:hypothetical protein B0H19DRAFT_1277500 [Mycena capillaripes]|nr:hypothetical protein B0H19DRAFT_1277500 [Mycena capillaripes]
MSVPLTPRGHCTRCTTCAGWVVIFWDNTYHANVPTSPQEQCACAHSWLSHLPPSVDPTDRNYFYRRGACASTGCGGYAGCAGIDPSSLCLCTATWLLHAPLPDGLAPAPTPAAPTPPAPVPPLAPPALGSSNPLMNAYAGIPAVVQGTASARRNGSAARTLPGANPFASLSNHRGPRNQFPSTVRNPMVGIQVVCWPNVLARSSYEVPGHPSKPIKIQNSLIRQYAQCLQRYNLVFEALVPSQGRMSPAEFSRQLSEHLHAHNLTMPPFPTEMEVGTADKILHAPWT